jgi:hypothetical protein
MVYVTLFYGVWNLKGNFSYYIFLRVISLETNNSRRYLGYDLYTEFTGFIKIFVSSGK